MLSLLFDPGTVGELLAMIPLGPVWIATYILVAVFFYVFTALFLDLPLPGATSGIADDEVPVPNYGEKRPRGEKKKGRRSESNL